MLGEIEPSAGTIKRGANVHLGYFDQHRRTLDLDQTVAQIVGDGSEYVTLNGKPRHVVGYLRGFLFTAKRALTPIKSLSGGERNRVILARLFTQAANLLILDEPTNDLDVETLEVLEERLQEYSGTLIVVSHDRAFLDNTVSSILTFESDGEIHPYIGNYTDWTRRGRSLATGESATNKGSVAQSEIEKIREVGSGRKLSYILQRELDSLPQVIDAAEKKIGTLRAQTLEPNFYEQAYTNTQPILDQLTALEAELERHISRWTELEDRVEQMRDLSS